jgi:6-phosphogluconate dehydrogenase
MNCAAAAATGESVSRKFNLGIIGLGVMGRNLALNAESKGFSVLGFDSDSSRTHDIRDAWTCRNCAVADSLEDFVRRLDAPRQILMMVPAGKPVDSVIDDLLPLLERDAIVIDGGNSFFQDTIRRGQRLAAVGIHYIGTGVSGGEEGALHGPALMPGGPLEAYKIAAPLFTAIAAKVSGKPCCAYVGSGGAGHYVKMVHNGIEYGIMQLLCEAYDIMRSGLGMSAQEMQEVFTRWNEGELSSYLMEITATVLAKTDPETQCPLVDVILDKAGQKGTGKWTSQNALDLGVAVPTINAALECRILSAIKDERISASGILTGPMETIVCGREKVLSDLHDALRLAILTCYAQGFALMREASREYGFNLDFAAIAGIWKGGCIIRARVLDTLCNAFVLRPDLQNLLIDEHLAPLVNSPCLR